MVVFLEREDMFNRMIQQAITSILSLSLSGEEVGGGGGGRLARWDDFHGPYTAAPTYAHICYALASSRLLSLLSSFLKKNRTPPCPHLTKAESETLYL